MEASSQHKLSAAAVVLLLVMAAGTGPVVEAGECLSASTTFKGLCFNSDRCNDKCLQESKAYSGGKCRGVNFTCWCITPCAATTSTLPASERRPRPARRTR